MQIVVAPSRSLGKLPKGQEVGEDPWAGGIGPGPQSRGAGSQERGYFMVHSWDPRITGWSPGAQTGMLCIRFLSGWDCPQSVNAWGEVGSQGCLRICSWTDISSPASGDTDRQSSLQVPGKENHSLATTAKG